MERNELCWCGSGKKYKKCHMQIDDKILLLASEGHIVPDRSMLKTPAQIEEIKKSAALNTAVLDHVAKHIHAGMSTAVFLRHLDMTVFQKVYALPSTTKFATEFQTKILF